MKFKLILFSLIITSLFLVSAFESEVYHIGIGIPSSDEENDGGVIDTNPQPTRNPGGGNPKTYSTNNLPNPQTTGNPGGGKSRTYSTANLSDLGTTGDEKGFVSRMTSAVIGTVGTAGAIAIPVFVFGIIGAVVFMKFRRK